MVIYLQILREGINMSLLNDIKEQLHVIRVRLYPNYLKSSGVEGDYVARTNSEASLSIDQVCAALKNRGGFTGNYEVLQENIRQFLDEAAYQLCDGFAVNLKYFNIYPNVGGTFNSPNEAPDEKKHPVSFRFRAQPALRRLIPHITVQVDGLAETSGWIDEFEDVEAGTINTVYVPGDQFVLRGSRIKITGDDPACGLYFVPTDSSAAAVKITTFAVNTPSTIVGIVPKTNYLNIKLEIRTQYAGSSAKPLKTPRVITSGFVIEEN